MLLKAILERNADVVCLQEVDHWPEWEQEMAALGYSGRARIDQRSPCLTVAVKGPKLPDSVAIFWRRGSYELDHLHAGEDSSTERGTLSHH